MSGALLRIEDLAVSYGAIPAVRGVSLEIHPGELRVILGANGAGKTTILSAILGLRRAERGRILWHGGQDGRGGEGGGQDLGGQDLGGQDLGGQDHGGQDLLGLKPHRIHRLGISWVPEARQLWQTMTVLENLRMGGFGHPDPAAVARRVEATMDRFPRLRERRGQLAGSLSGGEQQMVAIARALVSGPRLILMDEPSLGLAPIVVRDVFALVREINATGVSILMVEQNARQALKVADHAYLLELGAIVESGTAAEVAARESVQAVFLGGAA